MSASLLTCWGASVGVSISTQRRMPSRMVFESKGLAELSMLVAFREFQLSSFRVRASARPGMTAYFILALVGAFARGDLFGQFDDAAPELGVGDAREGTGQRQALGGRQKIGNVSRRAAFAKTLAA